MKARQPATQEQARVVVRRLTDPLLVLLLATLPAVAFLPVQVQGSDEAILLLYPLKMSQGLLPGRDFFTVYGPGGYRLLEGAFALTADSLVTERVVAISYHAAVALGVMRLVRGWGRVPSLAAGLVAGLFFVPLVPVAFAWFGGLALAVWSIALLAGRRPSWWQLALAGCLAGLTCSWRLEMAVLTLACVPMLWKRGRAKVFIAGYLIGLAPLAVHLLAAGPANVFAPLVDRLRAPSGARPSGAEPVTWVIFGACVVCTLGFLGLAMSRVDRRLFLSVGIFSLLMLPQGYQVMDIFHVTFIGCVIIPVAVAFGVTRLGERRLSAFAVWTAWPPALAVIAMSLLLITPGDEVTVSNGGRSLPLTHAEATQFREVHAALLTSVAPGSKVFVGARDLSRPSVQRTWYYYLLPEYESGFYFNEAAPGSSEKPGSALPADVGSADALILQDIPADAVDKLSIAPRGSQQANEVVARDFCRAQRIGDVELYLRGKDC